MQANPQNQSIIIQRELESVYYKTPATVLVNYIDEDGGELAESVTINGSVFDKYETEAKSFYGYELTGIPENAAGQMTDKQIVVTYVYRLKDAVVIAVSYTHLDVYKRQL